MDDRGQCFNRIGLFGLKKGKKEESRHERKGRGINRMRDDKAIGPKAFKG